MMQDNFLYVDLLEKKISPVCGSPITLAIFACSGCAKLAMIIINITITICSDFL